MRRLIFFLILLAGIGGGGYWYLANTNTSQISFRKEPIIRGDLLASVSATGTLEPEDVVDVGTQVPGLIKEFGKGTDGRFIDYGSPVNDGTVLARIDDSLFVSKVDQSRALLRSSEQKVGQAKAKLEQAKAKVEEAKANTQRSQADVKQSIAKANQSKRDWERAKKIGVSGAQSQSDYDLALSNFEINNAALAVSEAVVVQNLAAEVDAKAAVGDAEAAVGDAEAAVMTAKAALKQDEINLGYCTITSNVKGTIIDRRVTLGQTVQSSFNTPSLFLIAKDLTRMVVWASVNEADVSQIRVGQTVTFTVDAHANRKFTGKVSRIRLNATNTNNVVVFTVEVITPNEDGKLLPYMTANLQFEVDYRKDVILVPNAALRYRPSVQAQSKVMQSPAPSNDPVSDKEGKATKEFPKATSLVWVEENGMLHSVSVTLGISDGNSTEVVGGDLKPDMQVIVGEVKALATDQGQNPFAMKFGGSPKKK